MPLIKKATIKSYSAATHRATVQIAGSLGVWLDNIRVATSIPAADVVAGRQCTVLFLDPANQDDAVILTIQGALPSGGGGGVTDHGALTGLGDDDHTQYGALAQAETWAALQTFSAGLKLAAAQQIQDSGGTGRILLATASPHVKLTGDAQVTGRLGVSALPASDRYLNVSPTGVAFTGSNYLLAVNPASCSITATSTLVIGVFGTPAFTLSAAISGVNIQGLSYLAMAAGGSGAVISTLRGVVTNIGAMAFTGTVTDAAGIEVASAFILGGSPTITTNRGVYVRSQGHASIATVIGIDVEAQAAGTNRYGLRIADIAGGTIARILELGPTPYLRLLGSGNWTPTANQLPLYLAEGATPTLRQVQWKAGNALVAGDKVLVLV